MGKRSIVNYLPKIVGRGKTQVEKILDRDYSKGKYDSYIVISDGKRDRISSEEGLNSFYQGDNLIILEDLLKNGYREKFDLIYIDPPFLTNLNFKSRLTVENKGQEEVIEYFAYRDTWEGGLVKYLQELYVRLGLMKELLSPKGSIYVHLDFRAAHYVKILMDELFGEENFLNEVIWAYKSGGASSKYFARKHDNILVYTKSKDYIFNPQFEKSYNRGFKPYGFKGVEEFQDEIGWYTKVRLRDVWNIDMVGRTSGERVGYSTQKPEALLERIILTSSNEGSLVGDFFAGSGTLGAVAERRNRRWIMADKGSLSKATINKRLIGEKALPFSIHRSLEFGESPGRLSLEDIAITRKDGGEIQLDLELGKYQLDLERIPLDKKYIKLLKDILGENSLALIDFIGIDSNYQGGEAYLSHLSYRQDTRLVLDKNIRLKTYNLKENGEIYIKIIDVFGHESKICLELKNLKCFYN